MTNEQLIDELRAAVRDPELRTDMLLQRAADRIAIRSQNAGKLICGKCGWQSESIAALYCSHCGKPLPEKV